MKKIEVEISIIMSVYNGERWLSESIDSVLNQSYNNFELIVIDDGSTDKSVNILNHYMIKDKRIRVFHNKQNIGLTRSLNRGLELSQGKFIARIDCDDIWHPEKLSKQIEYLEEHPYISIVGTACNVIDENGHVSETQKIRFVKEDKSIRQSIVKFNPFTHSSILFKKDVYKELGGYNNSFEFAQDYEYWIRILQRYKGDNLAQALTFRRNSPSCITIKREKKQRWFAIKVKCKAIKLHRRPLVEIIHTLQDISVIVIPNFILSELRKVKRAITRLYQ
ncbi:MAG: glycosyltransferase [Deltaproteobacteria bacterium]|nr:glycosyltransferase [Deltaproteobacteria bacterium]